MKKDAQTTCLWGSHRNNLRCHRGTQLTKELWRSRDKLYKPEKIEMEDKKATNLGIAFFTRGRFEDVHNFEGKM